MSETAKKPSLDAWLRAWPEVEKPASFWENLARRVEARIDSAKVDATVADLPYETLCGEPLGHLEEEGHKSASSASYVKTAQRLRGDAPGGSPMTMPADREADRRSLQDLAKMATSGMTPPPPSANALAPRAPSSVQRAAEADKDDSGIVDLAMAAQSDPQGAIRAQTTLLANHGLFDDEPASLPPRPVSSAPLPLAAASLQQIAPPFPSIPSASSSAPGLLPSMVAEAPGGAHPAARRRSGVVVALVFGGLVAASSMAAGGLFYAKHQRAKAAETLVGLNNAPPPPLPSSVIETPPAAAAMNADRAPVEATSSAPVKPRSAETSATPPDRAAPRAGGKPVALAVAAKPAALNEQAPKVSQKDLPATPTTPEGDLGKGIAAAVGDDGKPVQAVPAAGNMGSQFAAGSVPQRPSQGAVAGALGAVLPGARACLGPDDPVSRASITFLASGAVQAVNVTGGAAGKPAAECIKAALSKAQLAPFAEASYSANITVRH